VLLAPARPLVANPILCFVTYDAGFGACIRVIGGRAVRFLRFGPNPDFVLSGSVLSSKLLFYFLSYCLILDYEVVDPQKFIRTDINLLVCFSSFYN
jgi:hypothetical protein